MDYNSLDADWLIIRANVTVQFPFPRDISIIVIYYQGGMKEASFWDVLGYSRILIDRHLGTRATLNSYMPRLWDFHIGQLCLLALL